MMSNVDWDILRLRLSHGAERDMQARERLMPRDDEGRSTRRSVPPPGVTPRASAVLALLYPVDGELHVPLTVRTGSLRNHSGEVSLPGGRWDHADGALDRTALRETWEELGVAPEHVELVANLTPVWIPVSNFQITPFVGFAAVRPAFAPAHHEVAELIEAPLRLFLDPDAVHSEVRNLRGAPVRIPYFAVAGHKVWGATALVLAQLAGRLREPLAH